MKCKGVFDREKLEKCFNMSANIYILQIYTIFTLSIQTDCYKMKCECIAQFVLGCKAPFYCLSPFSTCKFNA